MRWALLAKFAITDEVLVPYTRAGWLKIAEADVPLFEAVDQVVPHLVGMARAFKKRLSP